MCVVCAHPLFSGPGRVATRLDCLHQSCITPALHHLPHFTEHIRTHRQTDTHIVHTHRRDTVELHMVGIGTYHMAGHGGGDGHAVLE